MYITVVHTVQVKSSYMEDNLHALTAGNSVSWPVIQGSQKLFGFGRADTQIKAAT